MAFFVLFASEYMIYDMMCTILSSGSCWGLVKEQIMYCLREKKKSKLNKDVSGGVVWCRNCGLKPNQKLWIETK